MDDKTATIGESITLEEAIDLLKYPYKICEYENKDVIVKYNKNLYISWDDKTYSITKEQLNEESIIEIIDKKQSNIINEFKKGQKKYTIMNGEYGPFVNIKTAKTNRNIKIPSKYDHKNLTIDIILEMEKYKKKKK